MHTREARFELTRLLRDPAAFAVAFFLLAVVVLSTAAGTAWLAIILTPPASAWNRIAFVASFIGSTAFLAAGSVQLVRASTFVKMERQSEFRRCLGWTIAIGTAFVSVQTYGLHSLINQQTVDIATGVKQAAFAFILLHAVHILIALLFVVFISLRAAADRYDHEYSWGVTFCGWFWHGLGIVWLAIMAVFTIAGSAAMGH